MSPTLLTHPAHPARIGCRACPGDENASPGHKKSIPLHASGSATVRRSIGRRSLDAFSSIRGSLKGHRRALNTTTNQKPAIAPAAMTCVSAGASPFEPAKQKWYDSLRGKSSQIPLPSTSPVSMSSTLKRTRPRFFRPSPAPLLPPDLPSHPIQTLRAPLPKLELASFQADLRRMSLFGEATEKSFVEEDVKPSNLYQSPKKASLIEAKMASGTEAKSQETVESQEMTASGVTAGSETPKLEKSNKTIFKPSKVPGWLISPDNQMIMEPWRVLCDLYYKGTPSKPEHKKGYPDAPAALADFALRHMLSESRDCSPTLLWTRDRGETYGERFRVHQAFNVYPLIDGPRRIELAKQPGNVHWGLITFTDGPPTVKTTDMSWEDERLMAAVRNITSMGYHVDVWTCYDDNSWKYHILDAESQHRQVVKEKNPLIDKADVFSSPIYLEHRSRYEACMRHGIAGFNQDELTHLDTMQKEILHAQQPQKESSNEDDYVFVDAPPRQKTNAKLAEAARRIDSTVRNIVELETKRATELMGFLEHMEESITEDK